MDEKAKEALRLVDRIYTRLQARRPAIEKRERYYNGEQPLSFATAEWKRANASRYSGFSDNWTRPVVDAEAERIKHTGIKLGENEVASKLLWEAWLLNEMEAQSSQGFVTSLTDSRSYVIVWGDSATDEPRVSWEHPSNVEIEYDWANPRKRVAALKTWVDDELEYGTLFTADEVYKFQRKRSTVLDKTQPQAVQARNMGFESGSWEPREVNGEVWPLPNPIGDVPVVEIPNRPTLAGEPISEIQGVMPMQDAINLLWAYLFLAADYASMPARVVMGQAPPKMPLLDAEGKKIGERPVRIDDLSEKRMLFLTGENAKIASWEAARLDVFTDTIEVAVGHIAAQTRTPPTYLVTKTGMSNVNGEGLKASEIGLVKKTLEFQTFATPALREVYRLIALAMGDDALAREVRLATVSWMNPEIRSESQLADALQKKRAMGYPLEYLMELDGIEPLEIQRVMRLATAEQDSLVGFGTQAALQEALTEEPTEDAAA